jgi:hypothetical protein
MNAERRIKAFLNPLQFIHVDEPWASSLSDPISHETIVQFLCTPGLSINIKDLVDRYKEISTEKVRLFSVPCEDRILEKLVWPLRHAKAGYMVGNYLGTISLCGMVAEMLAMLWFDISEFKINNKIMEKQDQRSLFGSEFEKLGQDRRTEILKAYNIIDDQAKKDFDAIRIIRKRYLHLWSQDHERLPRDAVEVYRAAVALVAHVIGQTVKDGMFVLNPAIEKYLDRTGAIETVDQDDKD